MHTDGRTRRQRNNIMDVNILQLFLYNFHSSASCVSMYLAILVEVFVWVGMLMQTYVCAFVCFVCEGYVYDDT